MLLSNRRLFLRTAALAGGGAWWAARTSAAIVANLASPQVSLELTASSLPNGSAPQALTFPHFPDRMHAFVWRNWQLVSPERLAAVAGTTPKEIRQIGHALGLGKPPRTTADQRRRSQLTVIRRNWHLLPYDQLLELLGWNAEQLAYTLREDDFFFIKLGSLKPQCEPLRWSPPNAAAHEHEARIAATVATEFGGSAAEPGDPLFAFVGRLSKPPDSPRRRTSGGDSLRLGYSYFALYGDALLETQADPYPDGYLARLADAGVNAVWLQAVLYRLAHFPWQPELSRSFEERQRNLRLLVARARRQGIRLFLYLNEPRAMPVSFYDRHAKLRGVTEGGHAALCTSAPAVQRYLTESVAALCQAVPDLGGFFTITASENLTNCWSHQAGAPCPRCGNRPPAEVIAEVNVLFQQGIRQAGTSARLLAWDWGWNETWAEQVIRNLPVEVALMSVSEWDLPIERGGVKSAVGEYSISAVGPGPRAQRHWTLARERGLSTIAKIQTANSWELSTVPYLPVVANVARHAAGLRAAHVQGIMLSWTLGGCPSPNLEVVAEALRLGSADRALEQVAAHRFGAASVVEAVTAWKAFSDAFREFPFHVDAVYFAPQQLGPANLLWPEPTGYAATMTGFPYDDLDHWCGVYPPDVFARQMEKVATGFDAALAAWQKAAEPARHGMSPRQRRALAEEWSVASAAAIHFRSTANQVRFVLARRQLAAAREAAGARSALDALERLVADELALAKRLHALQAGDSRLGFEAANQYFYVGIDLAEKVLNCRNLLDDWLPKQRRRWET